MSDFDLTPTNTLLASSFDVLKMDNIQDPLLDVDHLVATDLEESYFVDTIRFVNEVSTEYTNAKIKLYESIAEAANINVVHESFSDFFSKVKDIIEKFLKWIKSLFQRFLTNLNRLISSDNYLKKHKDEFKKFKAGDEFVISGYEFTLVHNVPVADAIYDFNEKLLQDIRPEGVATPLTAENIKAAKNSIDRERDYDQFRAKVLGSPNNTDEISYSDFSEALFRIFRNDELDTSDIDVDYSYISKAADRFFEYKKSISDVQKQQRDIEKAYREVERKVKDITSANHISKSAFLQKMPGTYAGENIYDGGAFDSEGFMSAGFMTEIDSYMQTKVEMIQEYSNIHAMAFAAKLDALKDCAKQDRATLYTALSRIQRTDKKREG